MSFSDSFQDQQKQQRQQQQPPTRRYSSNNPFNLVHEPYLPQSTPLPEHQLQFNDIRPISVPVNDAFDYSSYNLGENSPSIANFPSGVPLLPNDSVALWASSPLTPSNLHHAAGPPTSQIQSPPFSSSSSDSHLHSKHSSLSPTSPIENEKKYIKTSSPHSASKYEPQNINIRPISPNDMARQRNISFAANPDHDVIDLDNVRAVDPIKFKINTEQTEEIFDDVDDSINDRMIMKRHRVATQRNPKGRPKNTPKRSKSIFARHHGSNNLNTPPMPSDATSIAETNNPEKTDTHRVYFNLPLPEDMIDEETGGPARIYPRNKVRTTKYTPLSFIPKNMYNQFSNVANIYFLFIVILGVRMHHSSSNLY